MLVTKVRRDLAAEPLPAPRNVHQVFKKAPSQWSINVMGHPSCISTTLYLQLARAALQATDHRSQCNPWTAGPHVQRRAPLWSSEDNIMTTRVIRDISDSLLTDHGLYQAKKDTPTLQRSDGSSVS